MGGWAVGVGVWVRVGVGVWLCGCVCVRPSCLKASSTMLC